MKMYKHKLISRVFLLFIFSITTITSLYAESLKIYHIDVDQGDATLFISPSGNTLLVDSGKNGDGHIIKAILDAEGLTKIDHVVTTHYHADHYGGIDELANDSTITLGEIYDRGDKASLPSDKKLGDRYIEYDTSVGHRAITLRQGMTIELDPKISVLCIVNGGAVLNENPHVEANDENDMSLALLIKYGKFRYFIGGDIELTTEKKIADNDLVLDVDVYQANHHGAATSSSVPFMNDLKPSTIIISNGSHGGHKHPRKHTLKTFKELNPQPVVFQTNKYLKGGQNDKGGNVNDEFIADLEASDEDGTILVTVKPDDSQYHVTYRDKSHSFPIKSRTTSSTGVIISAVLPNPEGDDRENESVDLKNTSSNDISLEGWTLMDKSGRIWALSNTGSIQSQQTITIKRNRMAMSLNNNGDTVTLLNENNEQQDKFTYMTSQSNQRIIRQ